VISPRAATSVNSRKHCNHTTAVISRDADSSSGGLKLLEREAVATVMKKGEHTDAQSSVAALAQSEKGVDR